MNRPAPSDSGASASPVSAASPAAPPQRRVVLCADDFGASAAVSQAVLALGGRGRLSATSAMVLSPRWPVDAQRLAELRGRIDVGLHLDWTSDFALAAGHGLSLGAAMRRGVLGGFDQAAARSVIERQLDAFEAAWQAAPDHIDGHQHVQQFTGIRQALIEVVARRYGPRPPWLRISREPAGQRGIKGHVIAALGAAALEKEASQRGIPCARALSGVYDFDATDGVYASHMARWLEQAPPGTVIMCHPATHAEAGDPIGPARAREDAHLGSDAFARQLHISGVRLVRGAAMNFLSPGDRP